jgi:hypothetical protein
LGRGHARTPASKLSRTFVDYAGRLGRSNPLAAFLCALVPRALAPSDAKAERTHVGAEPGTKSSTKDLFSGKASCSKNRVIEALLRTSYQNMDEHQWTETCESLFQQFIIQDQVGPPTKNYKPPARLDWAAQESGSSISKLSS